MQSHRLFINLFNGDGLIRHRETERHCETYSRDVFYIFVDWFLNNYSYVENREWLLMYLLKSRIKLLLYNKQEVSLPFSGLRPLSLMYARLLQSLLLPLLLFLSLSTLPFTFSFTTFVSSEFESDGDYDYSVSFGSCKDISSTCVYSSDFYRVYD